MINCGLRAHRTDKNLAVVELDLSGFFAETDEQSAQVAPLSQIALLVLANATKQFKDSCVVDATIRANLPARETCGVLGEITILAKPSQRGVYEALIDKKMLRRVIHAYNHGGKLHRGDDSDSSENSCTDPT